MRNLAALRMARVWIVLGGILISTVGVSEFASATCHDPIFKDGFEAGRPAATILTPEDGGIRSASAPVTFLGGATDPQDGTLSGSALVWCSSLDGEIGTGQSFSATLTEGAHLVILTATDADGNTDTDQISLTIVP
jgi:hypothetical protein